MFTSALIEKLNSLAKKPEDNATQREKDLYQAFTEFILNCYRIPADPLQPVSPSSPSRKKFTISDLNQELCNLLDMPDLVIEWLNAANAPTFRIISDNESVVFRSIPLSQKCIHAYNLLEQYQKENPASPRLITETVFSPIKLRFIDDAQYDMLSPNKTYVCISSFIPPIKTAEGKFQSSNLHKIFAAKEKPDETNFQVRYKDAIYYSKKIAELLNRMWKISDNPKKKVMLLDIKALNYHVIDDEVIATDLKSLCDGEATGFHLYRNEWCFNTTSNVFYDTTRKYTPDYPGLGEYAEHCPVFKYICTAICLNLFELATGEELPIKQFGDSVEATKAVWDTFSISKTRLGDLILKGLNNEIDDLDAFIQILNDPEYLISEGKIASDKLPTARNPIILNKNTTAADSVRGKMVRRDSSRNLKEEAGHLSSFFKFAKKSPEKSSQPSNTTSKQHKFKSHSSEHIPVRQAPPDDHADEPQLHSSRYRKDTPAMLPRPTSPLTLQLDSIERTPPDIERKRETTDRNQSRTAQRFRLATLSSHQATETLLSGRARSVVVPEPELDVNNTTSGNSNNP